MSIRSTLGPDGSVLWYDVLAGTVRGKKIRKRFTVARHKNALRAAQIWERQIRDQLEKARYNVVSVPTHKLPEIIRALELLEPYEVTIDHVVREWIKLKFVSNLDEPWSFGQAVHACLLHKRDLGVTESHLGPLGVKLERIAEVFGDRPCDQITTEELESYVRLRARTPHTWRNYRRDLGIVFNFAIQRGRATRNPAKNMPKPQFFDRPPVIIRIESVTRLLRFCNVNLYPYVTLGLFAGLRPFETVRLKRQDINLVAKVLTVTGKRSRSRSRRHVTISLNLAQWLDGWDPPGHTYWHVRDMIQSASRTSGVELDPDVFRHSFASHHLALHRDAALTAHEMGHQNQETLYRHYRELVSQEEGRRYFEISPSVLPNGETPESGRRDASLSRDCDASPL